MQSRCFQNAVQLDDWLVVWWMLAIEDLSISMALLLDS